LSCDSQVLSIDWHENRLVAGCYNGTIEVFDAQSGNRLSTVNVDGTVGSVHWSPCGNKLSAACNNWRSNSYSVKIFSKEGSAGFACQSTLRGHRYAPSLSKECFLYFG